MPRIERSVTIRRSVPEVFTFMDDVTKEHLWQPNLQSATQEPPGPVGVGTRKRYTSKFLNKEVVNTYRVITYEMFARAVYRSTPDSAIDATAEFRWVEAEDGGSRVTVTIDASPGGLFKMVPGPVLERASQRELDDMLQNLKRFLEED